MKWCSDAADQLNLHQNLVCWCFWGVTGSLHSTPDCPSCKDLTANVGNYSLTDGRINHACEPGVNRKKHGPEKDLLHFLHSSGFFLFKNIHQRRSVYYTRLWLEHITSNDAVPVKFCTHSVIELRACTCCINSDSAAVLHIGNRKGETQICVANKTLRSTWKHGFKNVIISD